LWNTSEKDLAAIHSALVAALENGVARPVIGKKFPLAEAARAHEEILKPGTYGKIILIP
jgi:NADPH:quinone reductase-like Zn-dependent oxidoreductase